MGGIWGIGGLVESPWSPLQPPCLWSCIRRSQPQSPVLQGQRRQLLCLSLQAEQANHVNFISVHDVRAYCNMWRTHGGHRDTTIMQTTHTSNIREKASPITFQQFVHALPQITCTGNSPKFVNVWCGTRYIRSKTVNLYQSMLHADVNLSPGGIGMRMSCRLAPRVGEDQRHTMEAYSESGIIGMVFVVARLGSLCSSYLPRKTRHRIQAHQCHQDSTIITGGRIQRRGGPGTTFRRLVIISLCQESYYPLSSSRTNEYTVRKVNIYLDITASTIEPYNVSSGRNVPSAGRSRLDLAVRKIVGSVPRHCG